VQRAAAKVIASFVKKQMAKKMKSLTSIQGHHQLNHEEDCQSKNEADDVAPPASGFESGDLKNSQKPNSQEPTQQSPQTAHYQLPSMIRIIRVHDSSHQPSRSTSLNLWRGFGGSTKQGNVAQVSSFQTVVTHSFRMNVCLMV
jgi:hypothetical protein